MPQQHTATATHNTGQSRLFFVLSTGQNIANLPPLLAEARPHDHIIWLESQAAQERKWTDGAERALSRHGFKQQSRLAYEHHPKWQDDLPDSPPDIFLVGNGGTKMQLLDIWQKLQHRHVTVLYGQDAKVGYEKRAPGLPPQLLPYPLEPSLTLTDVLDCSGFIHFPQNQTITPPVWPSDQAPALPTAIPAYGLEREATLQFHQQHHHWNNHHQPDDATLPNYETAWNLLDDKNKKSWLGAISQILPIYAKNWPIWKSQHATPSPQEWLWQHQNQQKTQIQGIYNATQRLIETAQRKQQRSELTPPLHSLGFTFEQAVLHRLLHWLQQHESRFTSVIAEIHCGAKIAPRHNPAIIDAEFDILILLRNGVLLHLECKSFDATQKDLDARLAAMWLSISRLARLIVITPVYTQAYDQAWAETSFTLYQRIKNRRDKAQAIAFTLPGQNTQWPRNDDQPPEEIPHFEDALEHLLQNFTMA